MRLTTILLDYETDEQLAEMVPPRGMGDFIRRLIDAEYKRRKEKYHLYA